MKRTPSTPLKEAHLIDSEDFGARTPRSCPLIRGLGGLLLFGLCISASLAFPSQPDQSPRVSGYWLADLGEFDVTAACGDQVHIWATGTDSKGLVLINAAKGLIESGKTLFADVKVEEVIPIPGETRAWVSTASGLYLVNAAPVPF